MAASQTVVPSEVDLKSKKPRACDQCRARKLACSKDPEGCARCTSEGIACHYSPQKQMGRPRKRQHVEISEEKERTGGDYFAAATVMDADFSFMDTAANDEFDLFDPMGPFLPGAILEPESFQQIPVGPNAQISDLGLLGSHWAEPVQSTLNDSDESDVLGSLDPSIGAGFAACRTSQDQDLLSRNKQTTATLSTPDSSSMAETTLGVIPAHSMPSVSAPEPTPGAPRPHCISHPGKFAALTTRQGPPCNCLAKLYLALDSLQNLPPSVGPAMACARNASKTAYGVTDCPMCNPLNFADPNYHPPVQAFQNLLMLGALLPSISHAYHRIMIMVDDEVAMATAEGRQIAFSINRYGGLWGRLGAAGFTNVSALQEQALSPTVWSSTVRALLRVDVYGCRVTQNGDEATRTLALRQIGLVDIVDYLMERQRLRHTLFDAVPTTDGLHSHSHKPPGDKENCERILEVARISIENLVIS